MISKKIKNPLFLKIFKNFTWVFLGQFMGRVLGFLALIILARRLGKEGYGMWAFAFALLTYGMLLTDFGLNTYGIIEVSRDREKLRELFGNIISMKLVVAFVLIMISYPAAGLLKKGNLMSLLIFLTFLNLIPFALNIDWIYRALEDMKYVALWFFSSNGLFLIGVYFLVNSRNDLLKVPAIRFFAMLVASGLLMYFAFKYYGNLIQIEVNPSKWIKIAKVSAVLAASFVMMKIYYNIDVIMLGVMRTMREVGLYSALYNFLLALDVVRFAFLSAIYPTLSRIDKVEKSEYLELIKRFEVISIIIGILAFLFVFVFSPQIIKIFYGNKYYSPESVRLLRVLIITTLLMFIDLVFPSLLIITKREGKYFMVTFTGALTNFLLNLFLIPKYGYFGAAYTTIISEAVILLFSVALCYKYRIIRT